MCHANPVMRLKDSLQFDDLFLHNFFWSKEHTFGPIKATVEWIFPPMCLLLLNLLQFEEFFCVCVLPIQTTFTAKSKSLKKKIIQINVISLITLRTHKNYWKKRLCIALFVARDFKKKPRELRMWQWSLSRKKVRAEFYVTTYIYTTTTLIFRPTKSY